MPSSANEHVAHVKQERTSGQSAGNESATKKINPCESKRMKLREHLIGLLPVLVPIVGQSESARILWGAIETTIAIDCIPSVSLEAQALSLLSVMLSIHGCNVDQENSLSAQREGLRRANGASYLQDVIKTECFWTAKFTSLHVATAMHWPKF